MSELAPEAATETGADNGPETGVHVIVQEWISLDGFAAGPGGEADLFAAVAPETSVAGQEWNLRLLQEVDEVLLGRRTYELFAAYWPTADEPIAHPLNMARKAVASRTLTSAPWGAYPRAAVVPDAVRYVRERRAQGGRFLVWGSLSVVRALLEAGEVDELDLFIAPIVLGQGQLAFPEQPLPLRLLNVQPWHGTLHARYRFSSQPSAG